MLQSFAFFQKKIYRSKIILQGRIKAAYNSLQSCLVKTSRDFSLVEDSTLFGATAKVKTDKKNCFGCVEPRSVNPPPYCRILSLSVSFRYLISRCGLSCAVLVCSSVCLVLVDLWRPQRVPHTLIWVENEGGWVCFLKACPG